MFQILKLLLTGFEAVGVTFVVCVVAWDCTGVCLNMYLEAQGELVSIHLTSISHTRNPPGIPTIKRSTKLP